MNAREFENLYQSYLAPVYRYCFLRLGSKEVAEDTTQAVFLKVWTARNEYEERGKPMLAYLFTIARNAIIDHLRRHEAVLLDPQALTFLTIADDGNDPRTPSQQREAMETVYRRLGNLDEEPREVLVLRYIAELSYEDISILVGKNQEAVRQIVSRGLKALRNHDE